MRQKPEILAPAASPPIGFARYWGIYLALWRNSVVREMQFKVNFLMWIVVELLWFALQVSFMMVVYSHTDRIADWSKWEVVLLLGASYFIQQVFTGLFLTNCVQISEHIRTGKLDFLLLLPVNTRFILSFRHVDLGAFVNAGTAIAVMIYAGRQLDLSLTPMQVVMFLTLALIGVLVHYSLMLALASASFWTVRAQGMVWGYYNLLNIARMPDSAFRGAFKAVFTFAIPILLVTNVPARVLVKPLEDPWKMPLLLVMAAGCFLFSEWIWRRSLKHYTSASS